MKNESSSGGLQKELIKGKWSTASNEQSQEFVMTPAMSNNREYVKPPMEEWGQNWAFRGRILLLTHLAVL